MAAVPSKRRLFMALPMRGDIYSRRGDDGREWWRVSELLVGAKETYVLLTRLENHRKQTIEPLSVLEGGGQFKRVEGRNR
jgi:hypothetical protein